MIGYLVREYVSRAGARNHRFDGGKIDYVCTGVHWLANGIIECYTRKPCVLVLLVETVPASAKTEEGKRLKY